MKISHLTILVLCLILAGAGVKYSLDQQKTMDFLVATHGNGELQKGAGLYQLSQELQQEVDAAASARKTAVDASEQSRLQKNDASDKRDEASANLQAKKDELADWNTKVEAAKVRVEQKKAEYESAMAEISGDLKDQLPDLSDSDLNAYTQAVKDYVETTKEEIDGLAKNIEETITVREGLTSSVAGLDIDLKRIYAIQKKFKEEYSQNSTEYTVADVDHRWHFVVFFADPKDGLLPGDTIPLIGVDNGNTVGLLEIESVNGNVIIARYDVETLALGRPVQAGDKLFRKTPLGH